MRIQLFLFTAFFVLGSILEAQQSSNIPSSFRDEYMQAERNFSKLSAEKGPLEAFLAFMTDDVILLSPNSPPAVGHNAIRKSLDDFPKTLSLTWEPREAEAASSGDIGYTTGPTRTRGTGMDGTPRDVQRAYFSVWRRQKDGSLKVIVDMGSPSPTPRDSVGRSVVRKPLQSDTAASGGFGYECGTCEVKTTSSNGSPSVEYRNYVYVWKKTAEGNTIVLVDQGNISVAVKKEK